MRSIGPFRVLEPVGFGATGVVFRAEHMSEKYPVALKVLRPGLARSADFVANYMREYRVASNIAHPHLIRIRDLGESGGLVYLAREYVEGTTLEKLLHDEGARSEAEVRRIGAQVLEGLVALVDSGLMPRGIQPSGVMMAGGAVRLAGVGLGRVNSGAGGAGRPSAALGHIEFTAPEMLHGSGHADIRSTVYSAGLLMLTALAGSNPFTGRTAQETFSKVLFDPTPDPRQFAPGMSDAFRDYLLRCISRNIAERYPSLQEALRALERVNESGRLEDTISVSVSDSGTIPAGTLDFPPMPLSAGAPPVAAAPPSQPIPVAAPPAAATPAPAKKVRYYRGVAIPD